jgi:hypothetical protein
MKLTNKQKLKIIENLFLRGGEFIINRSGRYFIGKISKPADRKGMLLFKEERYGEITMWIEQIETIEPLSINDFEILKV